MVIVLLALWLLLGLLGGISIKEHDGRISLLAFIIFILAGPVTLLVNFGCWLWDTDI